jgi:HEAT repeat protein
MSSKSGWGIRAAVLLLLAGGAHTLHAEQEAPAAQAGILQEASFDDEGGDEEDESPAQRADERYQEGLDALDEERWDSAIAAFDAVAEAKGARLDSALYWKAYALRKAGRKSEAMAGIAELRRAAPRSKWIKDAQVLEMEMRQDAGEAPRPEAAVDEEMKILAIGALMNSDPGRALPILEKFLASSNSRKLRDKALFVLAQNQSPPANAVLIDVARGNRNPDLQRSAIKYLGLFGSQQSRDELRSIYAGGDEDAKKAVLQAYMVSGDEQNTLQVARHEKSPALRRAAIQQLGAMGAQAELWQMYGSETDVDVKKAILQGMFIGGGDQRLLELSRTESNPELRRAVVRNLGIMDGARTGARLVELYQSDPDPQIRRQALEGLFIQGNAAALIRLARAEKEPARRRDIVQKLALMDSEEARQYMMELLK